MLYSSMIKLAIKDLRVEMADHCDGQQAPESILEAFIKA